MPGKWTTARPAPCIAGLLDYISQRARAPPPPQSRSAARCLLEEAYCAEDCLGSAFRRRAPELISSLAPPPDALWVVGPERPGVLRNKHPEEEDDLLHILKSRMPSRRSRYISLSCVLKLLLAVTVSQTSLVSDDLEGFKRPAAKGSVS